MYTRQGRVGIGVCSSLCLLSIVFSVVSGSLFAGCGLFPKLDSATGRLRVLITDTPFPIDRVKRATITVTRVEVRAAEDRIGETWETLQALADDDRPGESRDGGEWIVVQEGEQIFNLLELRNGRTSLLANAVIPAGTYDQMRLVCTRGSITVGGRSGGEDRGFELTVPSGEQTGVKIQFEFTVENGKETMLLLDVDLSRAFRPIAGDRAEDAAGIRGFHFTPSLAMRLVHMPAAGAISGEVMDASGRPVSGVTVSATGSDGRALSSTSSQDDGAYRLLGLPTGTYTVSFEASGYATVLQSDVQVAADVTTVGVNATLLPVPNL